MGLPLLQVDYEFNISSRTYQPLMPHGFQQYFSNLTMMLKWSPYSTEEELLKQVSLINYNLALHLSIIICLMPSTSKSLYVALRTALC